MRIFLDCIPCFIRQALDSARLTTDDEQLHIEVLRKTLRLAAEMDMNQTPPAIAQQIHRVIRGIVGVKDPYRQIKDRFNQLAKKMLDGLEERIAESPDRLETAVRLAIAGNIIDFGVKTSLADSDVEDTIKQCLDGYLEADELNKFKTAVAQAQNILYLTDNAGEIVFDRLLIEQLPADKVTVAVKGMPIINDATIEDAEFVGLTDIVEVIDNGSDAPGTILETCSQSFRERFEAADLIISKGQGNYETLSDINKNIFFILKVKCPVIARDLNCEVGKMILQKTESFDDVADLVAEVE
jgi:hypothetical protein